ncbi:MAG: hypothetical protein HYR56_13640 [Acidobacteria bacterium]|nr:hypothetical protein [Acidobacteriota bacterium]MBI3425223.1 hypothetical protein [Acidobacteriota bacterium]
MTGVETLRRQQQGGAAVNPALAARSPLIAGLFGIIPGLGAAYNGQNIKSLLHFIIPISLWQLGDIFSHQVELPLFLGGAAFYIFSIYDAVRTAHRVSLGEDLRHEDEALKRMLRENTTTLGAMLTGVGVLTLLNLFYPYQVQRFWPLILILAGLFLLRNYRQQRTEPALLPNLPAHPPSVIGAPYERVENNLVNAERRAERRFDQWR